MSMLEIFTNIISHPITQDRLINLRNVSSNGTLLIPLAIQTRITNQCHMKFWYEWNLICHKPFLGYSPIHIFFSLQKNTKK
jgi:hypothetical protein